MAINDLLMATIHQTYGDGGKPCDTVWSYRVKDANGNAAGLATEITAVGQLLEKMNATQAIFIRNVSIRVINLFSLTDFYEGSLTGNGALSGQVLPRHNAMKYTLKLDTRGINPGRKSLRGVTEAAQEQGLITDSGVLTACEALRVFLDDDMGLPLTGVYEPVVIGRIPMPADEDHPEPWYRLPENFEEANYGHVVAALFNPRVGHQITGE